MSDSSKANTLISGNKNTKETYLDNVSYASQKNWIFQQYREQITRMKLFQFIAVRLLIAQILDMLMKPHEPTNK